MSPGPLPIEAFADVAGSMPSQATRVKLGSLRPYCLVRFWGRDWIVSGDVPNDITRVLCQHRGWSIIALNKSALVRIIDPRVILRRSLRIGVECPHGFDVCPKCDSE
jgi:hypothetical protein